MLARPVTGFVLVAAGSTIAIGVVAVVVLKELLILALQALFKNDPSDLEVRVLVSKTGFLLPKDSSRGRSPVSG